MSTPQTIKANQTAPGFCLVRACAGYSLSISLSVNADYLSEATHLSENPAHLVLIADSAAQAVAPAACQALTELAPKFQQALEDAANRQTLAWAYLIANQNDFSQQGGAA